MRWSLLCSALLACSPTKKNSDVEQSAQAQGQPAVDDQVKPAKALTSEQSFKEGMKLLCDSVDKVDANLDPAQRQRAVAVWIDENVKNADVRELFSIMGNVPPDKRAGMMKAAAAKAGVTKCAIAER